MKESSIQKKIIEYLKRNEIYFIKIVGNPKQRRGVPDLICCYQGKFIAIEVKRPGGKATALQKRELQKIKDAGGTAIIATSVYDVIKILGENNKWEKMF